MNLIVAGVMSSAFIVEISTKDGLRWSDFYRATSFYVLIVLAIVNYIFHKSVYTREIDILKFRDNEYCKAYMRAKCLPEAAVRYKEMIRSGQIGELEKAMDEVDKILK